MFGVVLEEKKVDFPIPDQVRADGTAEAILLFTEVGLKDLVAKHMTILTRDSGRDAEKDRAADGSP